MSEGLAMPVFELAGVQRVYQVGDEAVHALNGIDLQIHRGEFLAVVGASGSGKSTLMHVLGLMDRPTAGKLLFEGRDVSSISRRERALMRSSRIGFVFQSFNLLPRLSVMDNVLLPLTYCKEKKSNVRERAVEALEYVGMGHRQKHRPVQLSGGERQRVAVARASINEPSLILADEPTGNLDSINRNRIMELFTSLQEKGICLTLVTHDAEVADYAARQIHMKDGQIVEDSQQ